MAEPEQLAAVAIMFTVLALWAVWRMRQEPEDLAGHSDFDGD